MDTKEIKGTWEEYHSAMYERICDKYSVCEGCPLQKADGTCLDTDMFYIMNDMLKGLETTPSDNIKQQFEASDMSIEDGTATGAKHYNDLPIQPIELMQTLLTTNEFIGFLKGNIIKYAMRAGHKGSPDKDKAKAQQYTDWLYEFLDSGEVGVKHD
jgi:hypothetical protein